MDDCIFCKIARKEIGKLVYEDDTAAAFDDLNPRAPTHVLIIPKKHIEQLAALLPEDAALIGHIMEVANAIAAQKSIASSGYRVVVNNGRAAGQSVDHLHFHLIGGRALGWPPG
ncbi:MAG: histidine triad nucleotide-binding protein [Armatimonadota bacterium]|nr:histidine triad nucleotide-binding protein [Armatimonadota bacterium]